MDFASLEPLAGGWSGETFVARVGDDERQVVRIHARNPARAEVDAAVLRLVRGLLPVPEVLDVRRSPEGGADVPGLLVTAFLPGERGDLVLPRLGEDDLAVLGTHVGELVAALGAMPFLRAGELAVVDGDLRVRDREGPDGVEAFAEAAVETGLRHWSQAERGGLLVVAAAADELLVAERRTCLVHSDLNPKNLLVDPVTLEVTGLVDWEYAHAGHPFTDLGNALRFDRSPAYLDAVLAAYERRHGVPAARALELARAADLVALIDLAGRAGQNPVADRAEVLLRAIAGEQDLATFLPGGA